MSDQPEDTNENEVSDVEDLPEIASDIEPEVTSDIVEDNNSKE